MMNKTAVIALGVAVCNMGYTYWITDSVRRTESLRREIQENGEKILRSFAIVEKQTLDHLGVVSHESIAKANESLMESFNQITLQSLKEYEAKLKNVQSAIVAESDALTKAREAANREQKGLPSRVTLDDLNRHYVKIFEDTDEYQAVESFTTKIGTLSFRKADFEFGYFPEKGNLVRLKIGKEGYVQSFELADAWLDEALATKLTNGYRVVEDESKTTTYGFAKWKTLHLGDMYCKIYRETTRFKGDTYNTTHQMYTFFVEVGSIVGNEKKQLSEYNLKIGS